MPCSCVVKSGQCFSRGGPQSALLLQTLGLGEQVPVLRHQGSSGAHRKAPRSLVTPPFSALGSPHWTCSESARLCLSPATRGAGRESEGQNFRCQEPGCDFLWTPAHPLCCRLKSHPGCASGGKTREGPSFRPRKVPSTGAVDPSPLPLTLWVPQVPPPRTGKPSRVPAVRA